MLALLGARAAARRVYHLVILLLPALASFIIAGVGMGSKQKNLVVHDTPTRKPLLLGTTLLTALLSTLLILLTTARYGIGVSPDSVNYLAAARSLVEEGRLLTYAGAPLSDWPPLYPMAIAAVHAITGLELLQAARALNVALAVAVILAAAYLGAEQFGHEPFLFAVGLLLVATSSSLIKAMTMAWSDLLFLLLSLLFLIAAQSFRHQQNRAILTMALITAFACLTRYIGVALLPVGAVVIWRSGERTLKWQILQFALFVLIGSSPLLLWVGRNYYLAGNLAGRRQPFAMAPVAALATSTMFLLLWFLPLLLAVLALSLLALRQTETIAVWWQLTRARMRPVRILLLFVALYLPILFAMALGGGLPYINDRLLIPLYIPTLFALLRFLAVQVLILRDYFSPPTVKYLSVASLFLPLAYSLALAMSLVVPWSRNGVGGYTRATWVEGATLQYLERNPELFARPVFSNAPDALYFLLARHASMLPDSNRTTLSALHGNWPRQQSILVWFENSDRDYLYTIRELERIARLHLLQKFDDGAVYEVEESSSALDISPASQIKPLVKGKMLPAGR